MLIDLGLFNWARLLIAVILFLGPGYGLLGLFPGRKDIPVLASKMNAVVLSFVLSTSFWAICLAWINPWNLRLSPVPVLVVSVIGWALGLVRQTPWKGARLTIRNILGNSDRLMLGLILLIIILAGIWEIRDEVAGPGSDSYHHTLFARMILEQGNLPEDYQPVTDLVVTFSYHFGFHSIIAVLGWLSGISVLNIVQLSGIFWVALAALSTSFIVEILTGSRRGALFAAAMTGLVGVFPVFMINWGRYPQLTGLILLPVWMGLMIISMQKETDWRRFVFLGILSAGLGFSHYRVAQMAIVGFAALLPVLLLWHMRLSTSMVWRHIRNLAITGFSALVLFSPWVWHVITLRQQGYPLSIEEMAPTFFQLSRLGLAVLNYPTNPVLLGLAGIAVLLGILRRSWVIIWLLLWSLGLWLFSHPMLEAYFRVDRISVVISLYIPAAIAIGWMASQLDPFEGALRGWMRAGFVLTLVGLIVWSVPTYAKTVGLGRTYLDADDLKAGLWIEHNTPELAFFMINLFHFPFSNDLIIGSDGGYWLPIISNRKTVSIPMPYMAEKFRTTEGIRNLKLLDQLEGNLCTPEAAELMQKVGVTHVYVGSRGGNIKPEEMLSCDDYQLLYQENATYVFQFVSSIPEP